ncbi:sugar isomerase domain-containing protein [Clostridium swellfunianum]|nr:sugar isomerase domain-containing protein [Clostridium swellfunianum]
MREILDKIERTQGEAIDKAAEIIINSITNNGMLHLMDTGHMLMYEAVGRTGGLMSMRPVRLSVQVENPTRKRVNLNRPTAYLDGIEGFPEFILNKSNMEPGDVLIIGSVSGKNILPVELALRAKERGINTIGITSVEYSSKLNGEHQSGKRLYEVCDIVLDNCGNIGDTLVHVNEINKDICPSSGIAAAYLIWALQAEIVEKLIKLGKDPSIYISNHMPDALRLNKVAWEQYERNGY